MNPRTKRRLVLSGVVVGSLAAVAVGGLFGRNWYRVAQTEERRREGLELFAKGEFARAMPALSFAARDRSDLEVILALAECRMAVPERENRHMLTARGYLNSVLSRDPGNLRALKGLLECYIALGYVAEIPSTARRVLEVDPRSVRANEALLEVAAATGRWKDAMAAARALQALEPATLRWRAAELQCLAADGADADGRLELIRRWRGSDPESAGLALLEADALRSVGRLPAARALLEELAGRGMPDRRSLEALLDALDAVGLGARSEDAIAASARLDGGAFTIVALECERLLRSGRADRLAERLASIRLQNAEFARLRFAAPYLDGRPEDGGKALDEAVAAEATLADDPFVKAARAFLSDGAVRPRLEALRSAALRIESDPLVAMMIADLLLEAGETDQAQALLVKSFERTERRWLPLGVRALRLSVLLGRVPEALAIARDMAQRYPQDPSVALAVAESWASAIRAGYALSLVEGSLGSDSPEALVRFWRDIGRPLTVVPLLVDAMQSRGERALAEELSSAVGADAEESVLIGMLGVIDRLSPAERDRIMAACMTKSASPRVALALATRLADRGDVGTAQTLLAGATGGDAEESRLLERRKSALGASAETVVARLRTELEQSRDLQTASFVLSQGAAWSDAALINEAVKVLKDAVGPDSVRAVVAEGTAAAVFHRTEQARLAASVAALLDASQRAPDSVSVLATLSRLLEATQPPDPIKALELLKRAVQVEPGAVEVYPDLVRLAQETGDFAVAEQAIEAYIRLVGDDLEAQRRAADLRERQGQLDEASQLHRQLAGRTRATIDRLALARIRQRLGSTEEARAILRELLETDSGLVVEREIALLDAREGRIAEARSVLDDVRRRYLAAGREVAQIDLIRADLELGFGDPAKASSIAESIARDDSGSADLLLARVRTSQGDLEGARAALVRAIESAPSNPAILPIAATVLIGDPSGRDALRKALAAARDSRPELVAVVELLDESTDAAGRINPGPAVLDRARELTLRYSGSPLVWRFAIELLLASGRIEDAARLGMTALSRLPNDTSVAEVAARVATAAGELDDALAAVAAWKRIGGADLADVETARATIELMRRSPSRAYDVLVPLAAQIQARASSGLALRMFVLSAVTAGREAEALAFMDGLSQDRRADAVAAWIDAARSGTPTRRLELLAMLEEHRAADKWLPAALAPLTVAAWTETCRDGAPPACERAGRLLGASALPEELAALLRADLAAARGEAAAGDAYRALYGRSIALLGADLPSAASRAEAGLTAEDAMRIPALAVAAMNNHAELLLRSGGDPTEAVRLARIAAALAQGSAEAVDCLARALVAAGRADEAARVAQECSDPFLANIVLAEVHFARGDLPSARAAVLRAQTLSDRTMLPMWSMMERLKAAQARLDAQS